MKNSTSVSVESVRNSPGAAAFAPDDVAGLLANWDPSAGVSHTTNAVDAFADQVSGQTLTATTTARPTFEPTGFNGSPSILFDGAANFLSGNPAGLLGHLSQAGGVEPAVTFAAAVQVLRLTGTDVLWSANNTALAGTRHTFYRTLANFAYVTGDDAGGVANRTDTGDDCNTNRGSLIVTVAASTAVGNLYKNGVNVWSGFNLNLAGAQTFNNFLIGAQKLGAGAVSTFANLRLGQLLAYNRVLTTEEIAQVDTYLRRFG